MGRSSKSRAERDVARTRELYSHYCFGDFCYGREREKYNRPLIDFLETVRPEAHVYDIGCGTGFLLDVAQRKGIAPDRLFALDLAFENAAALRAKGFNAACGNILALPFRDGVADVTICNGVLHHSP